MLLTISRMVGSPIMSLQTSKQLATIGQPIINPHDLNVIAFFVNGPRLDFEPAVLFSSDIRELGRIGVIVDSSDSIMSPDDLVRLKKILDYRFSLDRLKVIDDHNHKLGVVDDYSFDSKDFIVKQIFVQPTMARRLSVTHLTINRSQIIEIDNQKLVVRAPSDKISSTAKQSSSPNTIPFENPFRTQPSLNTD